MHTSTQSTVQRHFKTAKVHKIPTIIGPILSAFGPLIRSRRSCSARELAWHFSATTNPIRSNTLYYFVRTERTSLFMTIGRNPQVHTGNTSSSCTIRSRGEAKQVCDDCEQNLLLLGASRASAWLEKAVLSSIVISRWPQHIVPVSVVSASQRQISSANDRYEDTSVFTISCSFLSFVFVIQCSTVKVERLTN